MNSMKRQKGRIGLEIKKFHRKKNALKCMLPYAKQRFKATTLKIWCLSENRDRSQLLLLAGYIAY